MTHIAQPHTARAHATLAPSAANRWINCPGSIRASEGVEQKTTHYMAEGTAAHELASLCLESGIDPGRHLGHFVDIDDKDRRIKQSATPNGKNIWLIDDEMVDAVEVYTDHVRGLMEAAGALAIVDVEQRLDMRHIHPAIFGTGDAVVYDIEGEHLHVCDFKYGKKHLVSPAENPQLFLYGAGAVRRYHNHRVKKITLHVVQPRTQGVPIKSWETDLLDLFEFEGTVALAAARTEDPDAPLLAGEWCGFCPIKGTCKVRRRQAFTDAQAEFDDAGDMSLPAISDLSPEQRGTILRQADQIFAFVKAVQETEHNNALEGNPPAGFKLVAKRANRKWRSEEEALVALRQSQFDDESIFTEPKLKSPAQIETAIGKKDFVAFADLVIKKSSGANLVPNEDPRPAILADAMAEFTAE